MESNRVIPQTRDDAAPVAEESGLEGRDLHVLGHEFKTPIAIVGLFAELLKREELGPLAEKQKQALDEIDDALATLRCLVDGLVEEPGSKGPPSGWCLETTDIRLPVLAAVSRHVSIARIKKIALRPEFEDALEDIRADWWWLGQAIGEVLSSVISGSSAGGAILLRVARGPEGIVILVADQGSGITSEDLPCAEARSTGGEQGNATDFLVARRIIEAHGGHIAENYFADRGLAFEIHLPSNQHKPQAGFREPGSGQDSGRL